jgi:acetylornithine deacetylase/succinyl-diaminopimelate desuccinylase-like protein
MRNNIMDGTLSPIDILQTLIRFDTTNPPGNEAACIHYLKDLLDGAGISTTTRARDEARPNLVARLPGRGDAPPLLLYGHVDVVTTANQSWDQPPFAGVIEDGVVWGRGALDMKGGVAMMAAALLRARREGLAPPGDVILALVADEEVDGEFGAKFLVEQHPELFEGVRYAIGEGGGITVTVAGRKFYTIMVAEKQVCSLRLTVRGLAGHASAPVRGGAMAKLADALHKLDRRRLPVHVTPVAREMITTLADNLPFPQGLALRQLLNPALTDTVLDAIGEQGRLLNPLLHHTAAPTIVRGGDKINVLPSQVTLELDGRLLPCYRPDDLLGELRALLGEGVEIEVTRHDPGPGELDMRLYDTLAGILREADPAGIPLPYLLSGVTDARYFARLGIHTYGFLPMDIPDELIGTIHSANERIPAAAVEFGTSALYEAIRRCNA